MLARLPGQSIGGFEWLFSPHLKSRAVVSVLQGWSLPPVDLWVVSLTDRHASAKARAFGRFIEQQISDRGVG